MKLYKLICYIYSNFFFFLENIFLKSKKLTNGNLENKGIKKILINKNILKFGEVKKEIRANKYHIRSIYSDRDIYTFIENLFNKDLRNQIKNLTGFNYSIDYFGVYKNMPIKNSDRNKGYYANHYHFDKPYSKNLLKVFIPLSKISIKDGPLEIIDKDKSKIIKKGAKKIAHFKKYIFTGERGDLLLMKPNLCFHKAGIPKNDKSTHIIMLQLNPSINWEMSLNLYRRQFKIEPKFTNIINLFSRHRKFKS